MRDLAEIDWEIHSVSAIRPPETISRSSILRLAFSFPVTLAAALIVLTVLTVRDRFNDPDLWWHLKTGEIIWNTHSIPQTDVFSFTTNQHAWTAHEWLSQVAIYAAWRLWDYQGLMLWLCVSGSLLIIGQ